MSEHKWFDRKGLTCCQACGVVRKGHDQNKPCKGSVKIALREPVAAGVGKNE
jgi:hypothetical protein